MALFNIFSGVATSLIVQIFSVSTENLKNAAKVLDWVFLIFPHYSLCSGIINSYAVFSTYDMCYTLMEDYCKQNDGTATEDCWIKACDSNSQCCGKFTYHSIQQNRTILKVILFKDVEKRYFAWESPGIGKNIVYFLIVGTFSFCLLLAIEYGIFQNLIYRIINKFKKPPSVSTDEDPDVSEERRKIHTATPAQLGEYVLALRDVTKYYKNLLAVNGLCLGVKKFECFGLLGVNGAGKTTTFKMITGDTRISYGDAWVNGISLKKNLKKVKIYFNSAYLSFFFIPIM